MSTARKRIAIGVVVVATYAVMALVVSGPAVRPLFDSLGPAAPYRWITPPTAFAATNQRPDSHTQTLPLGKGGSSAATISTGDGQASVIFRDGAFAPKSGETAVVIKIVPSDPIPIGPAPAGFRYDGNAYTFTATYKKSGADATPTSAATIVLEFPLVATKLYRRDGAVWTDTKATPVATSLQIFSTSLRLGTFVAAGPPLNGKIPKKSNFPTALVISVAAAFAAVVAGLVARLRARNRRDQRRASKPAKKR